MAETFAWKLDEVERIDHMAAGAEARRNAALREIDRHRATLGATPRQAADEVLDAEFKEIPPATRRADFLDIGVGAFAGDPLREGFDVAVFGPELARALARFARILRALVTPRLAFGQTGQGARRARSLRAPRSVAAQIRHPRVRPRARRGRTARPRRGRELRRRLRRPRSRSRGRGLIRPDTLSFVKSSGL